MNDKKKQNVKHRKIRDGADEKCNRPSVSDIVHLFMLDEKSGKVLGRIVKQTLLFRVSRQRQMNDKNMYFRSINAPTKCTWDRRNEASHSLPETLSEIRSRVFCASIHRMFLRRRSYNSAALILVWERKINKKHATVQNNQRHPFCHTFSKLVPVAIFFSLLLRFFMFIKRRFFSTFVLHLPLVSLPKTLFLLLTMHLTL